MKGTDLLKRGSMTSMFSFFIIYCIILYSSYLCNSGWAKSELCGRKKRTFKPVLCGNVHITELLLERTVVVLKI